MLFSYLGCNACKEPGIFKAEEKLLCFCEMALCAAWNSEISLFQVRIFSLSLFFLSWHLPKGYAEVVSRHIVLMLSEIWGTCKDCLYQQVWRNLLHCLPWTCVCCGEFSSAWTIPGRHGKYSRVLNFTDMFLCSRSAPGHRDQCQYVEFCAESSFFFPLLCQLQVAWKCC